MFHIFEKKRWMRLAKWQSLLPYISCNGNDANSHTICNNVWQFSRKEKLINYSLYRRLANFQKEEIYNPPSSYIIKFNKTEATTITNFPRSSFYQKASRTWIINFTIGIRTFKDLQSASGTPFASFPYMVYCNRHNSRLSNR